LKYFIAALAILSSTIGFAANSFKEVTDPMSDAKRGIAAINSGGKITPVVKCDNNGMGSMYISFIASEYLGAVKYKTRNIKVRFDSSEPYEVSAYHDGSTASVFDLKPGAASGKLLTDMMTAKRMVVQLTTYDYDAVTDVFELDNAGEVIKKAILTCGDATWQ
jgi:hypothetical protein